MTKQLYLHVNTLAGMFCLSDQLMMERLDRAYIDRIEYSERNFAGSEVRDITPIPYHKDLDDLIRQINYELGTTEFGNGISVRVSWMHGTRDLPTPDEIKRAGGYLIVKCFVQPYFFNRARERGMRAGQYMEMRINQILQLMGTLDEEKVWWFIGDEPFSSYHWHSLLCRTGQKGGLKPFKSRRDAFNSYKKFVLGNQMGAEARRLFSAKAEYSDELEESGELSFFNYAKRMNQNFDELNIASGSTAPMDAHHQLEWKFSRMFILERVFLGGIQIGIAFIRGAAKQYRRYWGMYQEIWDGKHFSSKSYTRFNRNLKPVGGLSPSLLLHARLTAFFSGVHVNFIKAAHQTHFAPGKKKGKEKQLQLTPVGEDHKRLAEFCLKNYTTRGNTHTPVALLLETHHGWTPVWAEEDMVWGSIPFEEGDYMISNFFDEAFPRRTTDWNHLPFPPHHPFGSRFKSLSKNHQTAEYRRRLRRGYDHRPYEHRCLTSSRWGDSFDVLLENCSLDVLQQYPVVLMLGRIKLHHDLAKKLKRYVEQGGNLLLNIRQLRTEVDDLYDLLGFRFTGEEVIGSQSHCLICGSVYEEPEYRYSKIELSPSAEKIAVNEHNDVLIAENTLGRGSVIVTTPHYMQAYDGDELLESGQRRFTVFLKIAKDLINHRVDKFSPVHVQGSPVEYIINRAEENIIVTLINNEAVEWNGTVTTKRLKDPSQFNIRDLWEDEAMPFKINDSRLHADIRIPPWSFKIISICRKSCKV